MRIIHRIKIKLTWIYEDLFWLFFKHFIKPEKDIRNLDITIGITTFLDRYDNCLKPLLKKISVLFPASQIIVAANGHVKQKEQKAYLTKISDFCKGFNNVILIKYSEPKGLSYIWNQIILQSKHLRVLMLNDDLTVSVKFTRMIENSDILDKDIVTINGSWSHFLISKAVFEKVGPFDEGLLEIGGEDDDYSARLAMKNIPLLNYNSNTIAAKLKNKRLKVNSYGRDMNEENHGYSTYNDHYLAEKWEMANEPFDGAIEVPNRLMRYWKLRS
jgi:hypothetical protein